MVAAIDISNPNLPNSISFAQIQQGFTQYVVSPLNAFGLGGFVFDIEGTASIELTSEITDHFLEDNSTVQDNIAIKPQIVTLKNYVGEVVYNPGNGGNQPLENAVQKLTTLNAYLPFLAAQAQQIQNSLQPSSISVIANNPVTALTGLLNANTINNVADLWALTKNLNPGASKQQQAYLYFKALWSQKILIGLQTPFEFITNMAIQSVVANQDEVSKTMSDFTITLKKINVATTSTISYQPDQYQNRASEQNQPATPQGNNQGSSTLVSPLITGWQSLF